MSLEIKFSELKEMLGDIEKGWVPRGYSFFDTLYCGKEIESINRYFVYEERQSKNGRGQKVSSPLSICKRKARVDDDTLVPLGALDWMTFSPNSGHGDYIGLVEIYSHWKAKIKP